MAYDQQPLDADLSHDSSRLPRYALWLLIAVFFVALLPYAANYVVHQPDERHYTNAGIQMLAGGDYLTPRYPDGTERFHKPILTYWLVAAAYNLWGVTPLTSRLPFLLVGCVLIWLTYRLGLLVLEDRRGAMVAAAMTACNPFVVLHATCSVPDILLSLFVVLSAYGFVGIIALGRRSPTFYLAAYAGTGLAVATKGLPAVAFAGVAWLFALANPWQRVRIRDLVHLPSMILGGLLAGGWFVSMYILHGDRSMAVFFNDQVSGRVSPGVWKVLGQTLLGAAVMLGSFCPFNLAILRGRLRKAERKPRLPQQTQALRFMLAWAAAMAVMMGFVVPFYARYALPVLPLVAVVLADALGRARAAGTARILRLLLAGGLMMLTLVMVATAFGSQNFDVRAWEILLPPAALAVAVLIVVWAMRRDWQPLAVSLAGVLLLVPLVAFVTARRLALPDQGTQVARSLLEQVPPHREVYYRGHPALAAKIRVCSEGRVPLASGPADGSDTYRSYDCLVFSEEDRLPLDREEYRIQPASSGYKDLPPWETAKAAFQGRLAEYLHAYRYHFLMAVRKTPGDGDATRVAQEPQPARPAVLR